jgi:hypothetical protein
MIILGLSSLPWIHTLMGLEEGLVNNQRLFDGFSSNVIEHDFDFIKYKNSRKNYTIITTLLIQC